MSYEVEGYSPSTEAPNIIYDNEYIDDVNETVLSENEPVEQQPDIDIEEPEEQEESPVFEYPEYVDDSFKVPEFKTRKDEIAWYRENYTKAFDAFKHDKFRDRLLSQYDDVLISREKNVDELKALTELFKGNPDLAFKLYAPKELAKAGYNNQLSDSEIETAVVQQLQKEFGNNYDKKYDETEANEPGTYSHNLIKRQEALVNEYKEKNTNNQGYYSEQQQQANRQASERIIEDYKDHFIKNGLSQEQYDTFKKDVYEFGPKMDPVDIYRAMYFDSITKGIYEQGYSDGKKGVIKDFEKAGGSKINHELPTNGDEKPFVHNRFGINNSVFDHILRK